MLRRLLASENKRLNVFWKFYFSFFIFILVPSILASLFTYVYVVRLVESEMEKSSEMVIGNFADRTDELVSTLQTDMIKLLGYQGLDRFLRAQDEETDSFVRNEQLGGLMNQMATAVDNNSLANNAYMVLEGHDLVIEARGSFTKDNYFSYLNRISGLPPDQLTPMFTGKKMMEFTDPQTIEHRNVYSERLFSSGRYISAIISYPYNSANPKAYLVVNIEIEQLRDQIAIRHSNAFESAILNRNGELLAYTGPGEIDGSELLGAIAAGKEAETNIEAGNKSWKMLSYYSGQHDWIYVGLADMEEIKRPGMRIQQASAALLFFFLLAGTLLSYLVSKRMYTPIRDIKNELETGRRRAGYSYAAGGNELDMIRQWSKLLVSENKDMSALITGMSPVMHEYFLAKVLLGELRDELSIAYYAREIGFDANPHCDLAVMCIEIQYRANAGTPVTETGKSYLMIDLKHKLEKALAGTAWLCQLQKDMLVCILHLREHARDGAIEKAQLAAKLLEGQLAQYHATISVGSTVSTVSELHHSYQIAMKLLRDKGLGSGVQICLEQEDGDERSAFDSFLSADYINQILNWHKVGDYDSMLRQVMELLDSGERSNATSEAVKQLSVDLLNTWLRAIAASNKQDFSIEQYSTLFQRLRACATWEELRRFFADAAEQLFVPEEAEEQPDKFNEVKEYIQSHYGADLTIEQLARQLNMSVGHFSRSFKEAIGVNYIDYLTKCRIEAAKRLLLETDRKIDDIAIEVGYLGRNSFIKTFRKLEGVTPGKYRDAYKWDT